MCERIVCLWFTDLLLYICQLDIYFLYLVYIVLNVFDFMFIPGFWLVAVNTGTGLFLCLIQYLFFVVVVVIALKRKHTFVLTQLYCSVIQPTVENASKTHTKKQPQSQLRQ